MDYTIEDIVYTVFLNRSKKYGTADMSKVIASSIFYCKKSNIQFTKEQLIAVSTQIYRGKTGKVIDLSTLNDIYVDKFCINPNAILRFAACPNTEPTLLTLKGLSIHRLIQLATPTVKIYLRFDDSSPENKPCSSTTCRAYLETCSWLNLQLEGVIYVSERLERYYSVGLAMLNKRLAYLEKSNIKYYDVEMYNAFIRGEHGYTNTVLRIEDGGWVALRHVNKAHFRRKNYRVWPTLHFHSPIDDVDYQISHIYRGKDLYASERVQMPIYNFLMYDSKIEHVYWGRNRLQNYSVHSSTLAKGKRMYDADCVFITNLKYYHIQNSAILSFYKDIGLSNTDTVLNLGLLKQYQQVLSCPNYTPKPPYVFRPYHEHISNMTGLILVDRDFRKLPVDTVFRIKQGIFKLNKYKELIKLLM